MLLMGAIFGTSSDVFMAASVDARVDVLKGFIFIFMNTSICGILMH